MYLGKPALNYDLYPETRKTDVSGNLITSAKTLLHGRSIYDVEDVSSRLSERMSSRPNLPEVAPSGRLSEASLTQSVACGSELICFEIS